MRHIRNSLHIFFAWWGMLRYLFPSRKLLIVGVTGTSGKSSTIYFSRQILEAAGYRVGALSTIEFCIAGTCRPNDKKMTMLGRTAIQRFLRQMVRERCDVAIIEMTSEGYIQHRHRGINVDTIVLTNLYPEHIEAHGGFENYKAAKVGLFRFVSNCHRKKLFGKRIPKTAIVNTENSFAEEFLTLPFDRTIRYTHADALPTSLPGEHTAINVAAALSIARSLGVSEEALKQGVVKLTGAPGRIESIIEAEKRGFRVIVDYAFEPVAMRALYDVVTAMKPSRIIHVFGGTGGGRDRERRNILGQYIGERADICIVTNEDPYDDDPIAIIDEVADAVAATGKRESVDLFRVPDRRDAILKALSLARAGDVILITGKGSEQGIVTHGRIIPHDDRAVVREWLCIDKSD